MNAGLFLLDFRLILPATTRAGCCRNPAIQPLKQPAGGIVRIVCRYLRPAGGAPVLLVTGLPTGKTPGRRAGSEKILTELERRLNTSEMEELPRKPGSLPMLMRALSSEMTERKQLTDIILSDPSLTDQLLQ